MRTRPRFLVQIRFDLEKRWRTYRSPERLLVAVDIATKLKNVQFQKEQGAIIVPDGRVFEHVRIRHRGFTLIQWSWGSQR